MLTFLLYFHFYFDETINPILRGRENQGYQVQVKND